MARLNQAKRSNHTHEGAKAKPINHEQQLRRSVMACMLWEREFYEDGQTIAERIVELVNWVDHEKCAEIAIEARNDHNLRHVPLLIVSAMAKAGMPVKGVIPEVIQRADEMAELVAIHCHVNGVGPDKAKKVMPAQMKKGLANAFTKFNEYHLAKYNRDNGIKLRDVLFMTHPKPVDKEQEALWKRLANNELQVPDTWEVALSGGADKKETFERLLKEQKLGYMALLRNLRGMSEAGVDDDLIRDAILRGSNKALPFRFVAAARYAPQYERELDTALIQTIQEQPKLDGMTIVLVDVSGSMNNQLSAKSDMTRMDAACTLASVINAKKVRVFSFSENLVEVAPRMGMAGVDAIRQSQANYCTYLGAAVKEINQIPHDRLIVITDEQSHDPVPDPVAEHAYMINVASNRNGVGYHSWTHIDGFSESVIKFIHEFEK